MALRISTYHRPVSVSIHRLAPRLRIPAGRQLHVCRCPSSVYNNPKIQEESSLSDEGNIPREDLAIAPTEPAEGTEPEQSSSLWSRVKKFFTVDKAKLRNLGIGFFIAYSLVSNINYGVFFAIAWLSHVKKTGAIPFAKGQWKAFLAVYAGLWALQNLMRPIRVAVAVTLTPLVNQMIQYLIDQFGIKRGQAVGIMLFSIAVFTLSMLASAIWILGGIPSRPPPTL